MIERLLAEQVEIAAGSARRRPPVGAPGKRNGRRVAHQVHAIEIAQSVHLAPVGLEVGQQRRGREEV